MGFGSLWHWIIVLVIVLLLFGAGKLPNVMGDLAKGIKKFKAGLNEDDDDVVAPGEQKALRGAEPADTPVRKDKSAAG
jgi:sec-independent protein translocase protein TatA